MIRAGLHPGERVAIIAETSADSCAPSAPANMLLVRCLCQHPRHSQDGSTIDHIHHDAAARPSAVLAPGVFLDSVRQAAAAGRRPARNIRRLERLPEAGADCHGQTDDVLICNSPRRYRSPKAWRHSRAMLAMHVYCARRTPSDGRRPLHSCCRSITNGLVGFLLVPVTNSLFDGHCARRVRRRHSFGRPSLS